MEAAEKEEEKTSRNEDDLLQSCLGMMIGMTLGPLILLLGHLAIACPDKVDTLAIAPNLDEVGKIIQLRIRKPGTFLSEKERSFWSSG